MKSNEMWKLDLIESKFTKATPRFRYTKKLLTAKNNSKLLKKLPHSQQEAHQQIQALKSDFFAKKYYNAHKKLTKEVTKLSSTIKNEDFKNFIKDQENFKNLITSRIIKCIIHTILVTKESKESPPSYLGQDIINIITNKENPAHPSQFFKENCQNNKQLNKVISNIWNNKGVKSIISEIEWSFKVVRGELTAKDRELRKKETGKDHNESDNNNSESDLSSDDDSDEVNEDNNDSDDDKIDVDNIDPQELENLAENFAVYEGSGDEQVFQPDSNIDYNQVTDEEASESESDSDSHSDSDSGSASASENDEFFESSSKSKDTANLPQLATGYFSGGESDSDVDNDQVVKEATTQRKNRRGQRARQKIWAKKYGKEAAHIKKQQMEYQSERERRQREFEERERKRAEKARNAPSGSNLAPLGERKPRDASQTPKATSSAASTVVEKAEHPSWQAKRQAEEKLKNVKFAGKKIKFD